MWMPLCCPCVGRGASAREGLLVCLHLANILLIGRWIIARWASGCVQLTYSSLYNNNNYVEFDVGWHVVWLANVLCEMCGILIGQWMDDVGGIAGLFLVARHIIEMRLWGCFSMVGGERRTWWLNISILVSMYQFNSLPPISHVRMRT